MIGRRTTVGLSLLCALMFSALVVQGASATETAKNTTAFTCVPGGTGFADAHCNETSGTGTFGHTAIAVGTETEIEVTNEKTANKTTEATPARFKFTLGGVEAEITCTKVASGATNKSFIKNVETSSKVHDVEGTVEFVLSSCTVAKPANCTLAKSTWQALYKGVENVGTGATGKMGIQFTGESEKPLTAFILEGASCALKSMAIEVRGSMVATGTPTNSTAVKQSGATLVFLADAEHESLTIGGKSATFSGIFTTKMKAAGNPISFTTVT